MALTPPRVVAPGPAQLAQRDVRELVEELAPARLAPARARSLQGKLVLRPAPPAHGPGWLDADVRAWTLALFRALPHVAFFLRANEQEFVDVVLALFPQKHLAVDPSGKLAPDGEQLTRVLATVLDPAVDYASQVDAPASPMLSALLAGFGPIGRAMFDYYQRRP